MTVTDAYARLVEFLSMSDDDFKALIEADMRRPDDEVDQEVRALLRHPEVIDRTYATLLSMQKSVEGQLAARKEDREVLRGRCLAKGAAGRSVWLEAEERYAKTRAGSLRFKVGVEQQLMAVRRLRDTRRSVLFEDEANERLILRVQALEQAIRKHRDGFDSDDEGSDDDLELWAWVSEE